MEGGGKWPFTKYSQSTASLTFSSALMPVVTEWKGGCDCYNVLSIFTITLCCQCLVCTCFNFIFRLHFLMAGKAEVADFVQNLRQSDTNSHSYCSNKLPQRTVTNEEEADVILLHEHGEAYVAVSHSLHMSHNVLERTSGDHRGQLEQVAEGYVVRFLISSLMETSHPLWAANSRKVCTLTL